jgi:CheY-like chemotaxis protein
VYDSGIGIDEEGLSRLFEMFAQGPGSIHRSKEGLGIGLSLARSLVSLHGGSLEATSPGIGRGSVFTVRLPLSESGATPSKEPARMEATPAQRPWRLVIADDLQDNTDSLADLLRLLGHEVKTAYDGAEAVEAVASFKPEAVLLDIGMPKLDGYEACRRIRATPDGRDLIIVALTGWGQSIDRERTRNAGFTQHLVKPVDYVTLLSVLNELRDGSARAH